MIEYTKIGLATRQDLLSFVECHDVPADGVGGFLWAILTNDLKASCAMADDQNRHAIWELHAWLYNFAPSICWGDEENVRDWIRRADPASALPHGYDVGVKARAVLGLPSPKDAR